MLIKLVLKETWLWLKKITATIDLSKLLHENTGFGLYYTKIIVDRMTGVQYIFNRENDSGGMTFLVDRDGKPLIYNFPAENK